jgi:hypothetical protein
MRREKVHVVSIKEDATGSLSISFQTYFEAIPGKYFQRSTAEDDYSGNNAHNDEDTNVKLNAISMMLLQTSSRDKVSH